MLCSRAAWVSGRGDWTRVPDNLRRGVIRSFRWRGLNASRPVERPLRGGVGRSQQAMLRKAIGPLAADDDMVEYADAYTVERVA
jgi:hypothetical protein